MPKNDRHTPELVKKADIMFQEGCTTRDVATVLHVDKKQLKKWYDAGILTHYSRHAGRKPVSADVWEAAQAMLDEGKSCYAVSQALPVSHASIVTAIRKGRLRGVIHSPVSAPLKAQAAQLIEEGYSMREVAQETGISEATLALWSRKGIIHPCRQRIRARREHLRFTRNAEKAAQAAKVAGPFASLRAWAKAANLTVWSLREALDYIPADVRCAAYRNYSWLREHRHKCRNEKELDVIRRREAGETLQSIGDAYGITREGVRQMIVRILARKDVQSND